MKPYRNTARMAHVEHIFVGIPQGQALTYPHNYYWYINELIKYIQLWNLHDV